jgi:pilus assembly protein CpaE
MRVLIASDDERAAQRIWEVFARNGWEDSTRHTVPLELVADRASRLLPELVVVVLPSSPAEGLQALRETRNTLPKVHVLAMGPATEAKLVLNALHAGADEYVDESMLEGEVAAALVRFKAKHAPQVAGRRAGQVIAVLGPSGGSGSSTLAVNLSTALAGRSGECGLIDLRLAAGDLVAMLDLQPTHTIAALCDRLARVDQSMFEQFFVRHPSGVHLLAAPREYADIRRVTGKGVRRTLALSRVRFPYTVIDLDNAFDDEQVEALWQSDTVFLVLRLDYTSVRNARRALDNIKQLGIGLDRVRLVANRYREAKQLRAGQAEEALEMRIKHYIPDDPARVNRAINKGIPLVLQRPSAKVSKSIVDLATSANGKFEPSQAEETVGSRTRR